MTVAIERFEKVLRTEDDLRAIYAPPGQGAANKDIGRIDPHARSFIALAPFLLLGTSGASGTCDVSPKGDRPGFVLVLDEKTIAIPDRPGNRRIDSLRNLVQNPRCGLLFMVPGLEETLRINGTAEIVRDDRLLEALEVDGKRPIVAIVVTVEECFMHCAKAFLRSGLWDVSTFRTREDFPSLARVINDQTRPADRPDAEHERIVAETADRHAEAYRCLY